MSASKSIINIIFIYRYIKSYLEFINSQNTNKSIIINERKDINNLIKNNNF